MKIRNMFYAGVEVDGNIYFSEHILNAIFKQNRETGELTYLGTVSENKQSVLHNKAIHYKNRIYFIPALGDYIAKLSLENESISTIAVPTTGHKCSTNKFIDAVVDGKAAWLIPMGYDALVHLDMETDELTSYANWPEEIKWKNEGFLMFGSGILVSELICLCPCEGEYFVTFHTKTKEMKAWKWEYPPRTVCGVICHKNCVWILPGKKYPYITKYSLETGSVTKIEVKDEAGGLYPYSATALVGDTIVSAPYESRQWRMVNTLTDEVTYVPFKDDRIKQKYPYYQFVTVLSDGVKMSGNRQSAAHFISSDTQEISETDYQMEERAWLFAFASQYNASRDKSKKKMFYGEKIYSHLREDKETV